MLSSMLLLAVGLAVAVNASQIGLLGLVVAGLVRCW